MKFEIVRQWSPSGWDDNVPENGYHEEVVAHGRDVRALLFIAAHASGNGSIYYVRPAGVACHE